jgi:hypothetical protein
MAVEKAGYCELFMIHMNNSNASSRSSAFWTNGSFCAPTHFETDRSIHWLNDDGDREGPSIAQVAAQRRLLSLFSHKHERYGSDGVYIFVIERWHLAPKRGEFGRRIAKQCMTD